MQPAEEPAEPTTPEPRHARHPRTRPDHPDALRTLDQAGHVPSTVGSALGNVVASPRGRPQHIPWMCWPALAQAPAFRAPGGAASDQDSSDPWQGPTTRTTRAGHPFYPLPDSPILDHSDTLSPHTRSPLHESTRSKEPRAAQYQRGTAPRRGEKAKAL